MNTPPGGMKPISSPVSGSKTLTLPGGIAVPGGTAGADAGGGGGVTGGGGGGENGGLTGGLTGGGGEIGGGGGGKVYPTTSPPTTIGQRLLSNSPSIPRNTVGEDPLPAFRATAQRLCGASVNISPDAVFNGMSPTTLSSPNEIRGNTQVLGGGGSPVPNGWMLSLGTAAPPSTVAADVPLNPKTKLTDASDPPDRAIFEVLMQYCGWLDRKPVAIEVRTSPGLGRTVLA